MVGNSTVIASEEGDDLRAVIALPGVVEKRCKTGKHVFAPGAGILVAPLK